MTQQRPNIILIVVDTARAQNFSCYGYNRATTPAVDSIAEEGVRFENVSASSPWTLPSHASIFTGLYSSQHGAHAKHKYLDATNVTMAELLQWSGYKTVAINGNSWISDTFGFDRGFDDFIKLWQWFQTTTDVTNATFGMLPESYTSRWRQLLKHLLSGNALKNVGNAFYARFLDRRYDYGGRRATAEAKRWIRDRISDEQPFFMFINYLEPHLEYKPPLPFRHLYTEERALAERLVQSDQIKYAWQYIVGHTQISDVELQTLRSLYDAELSYTDSLIKELYDFLDTESLLDETILAITSDHGENIGEHKLMDHQYCLYETLLNVPLIIRYPKRIDSGQVISEPAQLVDILPTVLELADVQHEHADSSMSGGISLLSGGSREFVVSEYLGPQPTIKALQRLVPDTTSANLHKFERALRAIKVDQWKYIWSSDGSHELYDLSVDPTESTNVIGNYPSVETKLQSKLDEWVSSVNSQNVKGEQDVEMDDATRQRLEALGYL